VRDASFAVLGSRPRISHVEGDVLWAEIAAWPRGFPKNAGAANLR